MTHRESLCALVFGTFTFAVFGWLVLADLIIHSAINPNLRRGVNVVLFAISALALAGYFWNSQRKIGLLYLFLVSLGGMCYIMESSDAIPNYLMIPGPLRYSQIVWPTATLVRAILAFRDSRIPSLLAVFSLVQAITWYSINVDRSSVQMQMMLGFANDVASLLASGGLAVWLIFLGWWSLSAGPTARGVREAS